MKERSYRELQVADLHSDAPIIVSEIKGVLGDIANAENAHGNKVVEETFKLSEQQVISLFNNPLWLAELDTLHYRYFFTTPKCDGEYLLNVRWSESWFARTDDMHARKLILATLGMPPWQLDALRLCDVIIYTVDEFIEDAWYMADQHFMAIPEVNSEYSKKFYKITSRRFLLDEDFESVTKEMLEEYWLKHYGVRDIEELRVDIGKLKLTNNEVLTRCDGMDFVVRWSVVKSNE